MTTYEQLKKEYNEQSFQKCHLEAWIHNTLKGSIELRVSRKPNAKGSYYIEREQDPKTYNMFVQFGNRMSQSGGSMVFELPLGGGDEFTAGLLLLMNEKLKAATQRCEAISKKLEAVNTLLEGEYE